MDIRKIKTLIELLEGSDVTEIEICEGEESVRISRGHVAPVYAPAAAMPFAAAHPAPVAPAAASAAPPRSISPTSRQAPSGRSPA